MVGAIRLFYLKRLYFSDDIGWELSFHSSIFPKPFKNHRQSYIEISLNKNKFQILFFHLVHSRGKLISKSLKSKMPLEYNSLTAKHLSAGYIPVAIKLLYRLLPEPL